MPSPVGEDSTNLLCHRERSEATSLRQAGFLAKTQRLGKQDSKLESKILKMDKLQLKFNGKYG